MSVIWYALGYHDLLVEEERLDKQPTYLSIKQGNPVVDHVPMQVGEYSEKC